MVLSFIFMKAAKFVFSIVALLLLLVMVILPGIFSVNVLTHEFYHAFRHKDAAKSICVDINQKPYVAHTIVVFPNATAMRTYVESVEDGEEGIAADVGQVASVIYVLFCLVAISLVAFIVVDCVRPVKRHVIRHVRRLRRRLGKR